MDFSKRLSCILAERGLTQRELANMCGVDEASMSRYVNGSRKPCMDVLVRIAGELNVSVEYLTGKEEETSFKEIKHLLCSNLCRFTDEQRLELMEMIAKKK
ncbi:MAG: helix-turn-helix transcriptional regulator [Lachnospiraceae bacterium]|nr:helix-turn-helix transcriptional regulator [Lachnospiraceae bacterium]MBR3036215.1 helix-turn-helix transcriptional regulator [Lachnospiraceae bacterium]